MPDRALVLDWVFADGPPGKAAVYDNNKRQDFHAIVPESIPDELYWVEEEHQIFQKLQEERRSREEAIRAKVCKYFKSPLLFLEVHLYIARVTVLLLHEAKAENANF